MLSRVMLENRVPDVQMQKLVPFGNFIYMIVYGKKCKRS